MNADIAQQFKLLHPYIIKVDIKIAYKSFLNFYCINGKIKVSHKL